MQNEKISTAVGTIAILIVAVTFGMLVWKIEKNQPNNEQITETSIPTKNPILNNQEQIEKDLILPEEIGKNLENISMEGWKLFVNKKDGYSIKYPDTWTYKTRHGQEEGLFLYHGKYKMDNFDTNLDNIKGDYLVDISVYREMGTHVTDVKDWRKHDGKNYQEVLINGRNALKFSADSLLPNIIRYYFIGNNNGYEITVYYKDASDKISEKIISTMGLLK